MVVSASGGSSAIFLGSLSGSGGSSGGGDIFFLGDLRPGNSPASVTFDNNVTFAHGALDVEIGGTSIGSQYDHIKVTGSLSLGGTLKVSTINSFTPAAGQSFDLLDWGTLAGAFNAIQLPTLPLGLSWNTSQLYATGVLSVVAQASADFNHNGVVDMGDYVAWRKGMGTIYTQSDYDNWRTHFGQTVGSGTTITGSAVVPEPAVETLLLGAVVGFGSRRRQRRNRGPLSARRSNTRS
jgi:hypothetical protein